MNPRDLTAVVHLVGFATGIILYAMLGVMTRRRLAYVSAPTDRRAPDHVPLVAALLGVVWNVGAMLAYAVRDFSVGEPLPFAAALAYTALGALPAVVVHSALNRAGTNGQRGHRALVVVTYGASVLAGVMHLAAAARGDMFSPTALILLTTTYAIVLGVLVITERRQPGFHRTITAVALAAFAVSALHLSRHPGLVDQDPWPVELIGHHASLPLVLAILYQDYRFAFADLFLKRALSVLALMAVVGLLYATLAAPLIDPHALAARRALNGGSHLLSTAALLALWSATALAYPLIQRVVFRFVDRVVLRRVDYRVVRGTLATRLSSVQDVAAALDTACELLGTAVDASSAGWREARHRPAPGESIVLGSRRIDACIVVPTTLDPTYEIVLGELRGGRTLLSDDLVLMDGAAASVARRVDELRLESDRRDREQHEREVLRLATESELRALRAQLNPHFLFNALNTLGHLMQAAPDRALRTLYQLTGLLRAVLRRSNGEFVALREELEIVESYLAIEHERFQERLIVEVDVPDDLRHSRIPPLILQPLVENAVKHGIAPKREGGRVTVRVERDGGPLGEDSFLRLFVIDTGRGFVETERDEHGGVGLSNIESRLRHYYGAAAAVAIRETPGGGTTVELRLPHGASSHVVMAGR